MGERGFELIFWCPILNSSQIPGGDIFRVVQKERTQSIQCIVGKGIVMKQFLSFIGTWKGWSLSRPWCCLLFLMVAIMALSLLLVCVRAHVRFGSLAPCGFGSRFCSFWLLFLVWGERWLPALLWLARPAPPPSPCHHWVVPARPGPAALKLWGAEEELVKERYCSK